MYKIWRGADPMTVLTGLFFSLGVLSIVLHLFAFSAVGYPKSTKAKYNPAAVATP